MYMEPVFLARTDGVPVSHFALRGPVGAFLFSPYRAELFTLFAPLHARVFYLQLFPFWIDRGLPSERPLVCSW